MSVKKEAKKVAEALAKKIAKNALNKVEEEVSDPKFNAVVAGFKVKQLVMDVDLHWKFKVEVNTRLSKAYSDYIITLFFDDEPYERRLDDLTQDIDDLARDQGLFDKSEFQANKDEIDRYNEKKDKVSDEYKDLQKRCRPIEFSAQVFKIEYPGKTVITLKVPADIVGDINDMRNLLSYYKIEFNPDIDTINAENDKGVE